MPRIFVSLLEGDCPATARPLLASSDRALVELIRRELSSRLADRPRPRVRRHKLRETSAMKPV